MIAKSLELTLRDGILYRYNGFNAIQMCGIVVDRYNIIYCTQDQFHGKVDLKTLETADQVCMTENSLIPKRRRICRQGFIAYVSTIPKMISCRHFSSRYFLLF